MHALSIPIFCCIQYRLIYKHIMVPLQKKKAELYRRYPPANVLIYNGTTILHFALGGVGIVLGYEPLGWIGYAIGFGYLLFAFGEMYLRMPLRVCPNCVYYRLDKSRCISGLNIVSRRWASAGKLEDFANRAKGPACSNNLYMVALLFPIVALVPALWFHFSWNLLAILCVVIGLLVFRFFIIFPKLACLHCHAKFKCPQAGRMGVRDL